MFNDDIQSTAVLASLYGANAKFFIVDKDGLITKGRHNLEEREEQAVDTDMDSELTTYYSTSVCWFSLAFWTDKDNLGQ